MFSFIVYILGFIGISFIPIVTSIIFRYERAIVSLDTIIILLFISFKKKKLSWFFLLIFILYESIYGFSQEYPLINLRNIFSLIPFARFANTKVILYFIVVIIIFTLFSTFSILAIYRNRNSQALLAILLIIAISSNFEFLTNFNTKSINKLKFFHQSIFGSTAYELYYKWKADGSEWGTMDDNENFYPLKTISASSKIFISKNSSKKILFILVESWGVPNNKKEYAFQIESFVKNDNIKILENSTVEFSGGTVSGELRELCNITPISYAFSIVPNKYAENCLPAAMHNNGYKTFALHSAHSGMYSRGEWYPTVGFNEYYFLNKPLANVERCHSFPGFCDIKLIPYVINKIKENDKLFFYWMTLNSHLPYDSRDLTNKDKSSCTKLNLQNDARCNQFLLIKEFFESLSREISDDKLSGLEIVLVGDHAPPFIDISKNGDAQLGLLQEKSSNDDFVSGLVPYIHLRVVSKKTKGVLNNSD